MDFDFEIVFNYTREKALALGECIADFWAVHDDITGIKFTVNVQENMNFLHVVRDSDQQNVIVEQALRDYDSNWIFVALCTANRQKLLYNISIVTHTDTKP